MSYNESPTHEKDTLMEIAFIILVAMYAAVRISARLSNGTADLDRLVDPTPMVCEREPETNLVKH